MADEVFCTATSYAVVHATTFEGQKVGSGQPGPVFQRLRQAWIEAVGVDFVAQSHHYHERLPDWERQAQHG